MIHRTRLNAVGLIMGMVGLISTQQSSGYRLQDMWSELSSHAVQVEHYNSLVELANAADAVVLGRLGSAEPGRRFGHRDESLDHPDDPVAFYVEIGVEVIDVLSGHLEPDWTLEVMVPTRRSVDDVREHLGDQRVILFVRSKAGEAQALGRGQRLIDENIGYYRLVRAGAAIRDNDGLALPVVSEEPAFAGVESRGFDEVVAAIRSFGQ